jgi:hypothetical protein
MEGWTDFFVAEVGAAAALAGLLVVAVSINVTRIMSFPLLPGRAAQTLIIIAGSLLVSSFALFPGQPPAVFGAEAAVIALAVAASGMVQFRNAYRQRKGGPAALDALSLRPRHSRGAADADRRDAAGCRQRSGVILDRHRDRPEFRRDPAERLGAAHRNPALGVFRARHPQTDRAL